MALLPQVEKDFTEFFSGRNFEKSRRFSGAHEYSPEPLRAVLKSLGNPQHGYRTWHAAGTVGKGSVCRFFSSILSARGMRTGLYLSPHLVSITERIVIADQQVSPGEFEILWGKIRPMAAELSYFDALTAMAFLAFADAGVSDAVIETGLGGRLDSTNNLHPEAVIITRIGTDHAEILGDNLRLIAAEKAGIFRSGIPVYSFFQEPEVAEVLSQAALEKGCPITFYRPENPASDYLTENRNFAVWISRSVFPGESFLPAAGMPGRLEKLSDHPEVYFDCAHNEDGIRAALDWWRRQPPGKPWQIWFNCDRGRDAAKFWSILREETGEKFSGLRFLRVPDPYFWSESAGRDVESVDAGMEKPSPEIRTLVLGSFRLYPLFQAGGNAV